MSEPEKLPRTVYHEIDINSVVRYYTDRIKAKKGEVISLDDYYIDVKKGVFLFKFYVSKVEE